jgi:PDZ domain-containing protein
MQAQPGRSDPPWWRPSEHARRSRAALTSAPFLTAALIVGLLALAGALLFTIPTPYQVLMPGPVTDVQSLIEPKAETSRGALLLTTIYSDPASVGEWLYARVSPDAGIIPREEARPTNVDEKQYQKLLVTMMDESKIAAKVVALRAAGYDVKVTGQGAQVQEILDQSKAKGILEAGDIVVGADGQPIATANDLVALIQGHRPGDTMELTIKRGDETLPVEMGLVEATDEPGRARAGLLVTTHLYEYQLPVDLDLRTREIGGPSGGLMFALGIYNAVTEGDITNGNRIAGTGTITTDGRVGAVGGVKYKVLAAEKAGASLFLVPQDNYSEATAGPSKLKVVPVGTFDEALAALRDLPAAA